jgi:hypothetical protein
MQEFIIVDNSIKFDKAQNILDERLIYSGDNLWNRQLNKAFKYTDINKAIEDARGFRAEAPVKVYAIQINGPMVNITEVNF